MLAARSSWLTHHCAASVVGILVFQLKRRPPDHVPRKGRKYSEGKLVRARERAEGAGYGSALPPEKLPYLVELSPGESLLRAVHLFSLDPPSTLLPRALSASRTLVWGAGAQLLRLL